MLHKFVKKVGPEVHFVMNSVVLFTCLVLLAAVAVLIFKHEKLKLATFSFVNQATIASKLKYIGADATEDGQMLATTIATAPQEKPLFTDKLNLEKLVFALSKQTSRNIIVEDTHQVILADGVAANVGKLYTYANNLDAKTMQDGNPRRFTEISADYPSGVDEVVVPVRNAAGTIIGAVFMSTSTIFNN